MKAPNHISYLLSLIWLVLCASTFTTAAYAQESEGLPVYTGAKSRPFSGRMLTNMVPLDVAVFETADDIEKVLLFYRKAIESQGKPVVEHAFGSSLVYIGYYDLETETIHLATVMNHGPGKTWIILSAMDPRQLQKPTKIPEWLPWLEGASDLVITQDSEIGAQNCSASFTVSGKSMDEVRKELTKKAGELGWQRDENASEDGETISFHRGDSHCMVHLRMVNEDKPQVTVSWIMFGGYSESTKRGGSDAKEE